MINNLNQGYFQIFRLNRKPAKILYLVTVHICIILEVFWSLIEIVLQVSLGGMMIPYR